VFEVGWLVGDGAGPDCTTSDTGPDRLPDKSERGSDPVVPDGGSAGDGATDPDDDPGQRDRTTVIAGVGEVLGTALAREFAGSGDRVALLARSTDRIDALAAELRSEGAEAVAVTTDVTDPDSVREAFEAVRSAFGTPDVLLHNVSAPAAGSIDDADPEAFARPWRRRTYGGYLCVREFLRHRSDDGESGGAVLFSGSSYATDPSGELPGWDSAAAATRGLARSLAEDLEPRGIHVAYVAIGGSIAPPGGYATDGRIPADEVAAEFRRILERPEPDWRREVEIAPGSRS
jgi:NAD(P)-dependent dehydrogenase (short-subunit alcohol dehydrogenase family)